MTRLLLVATFLLAGCNTGFEPQYRVRDVRVLAVRSGAAGAAADVFPGDTLHLDALVANPLGRPDLTVTWYACLPEASEAKVPCADTAVLGDPHRLAGIPGVVQLGVTSFPTPGPDPAVVASLAVPLLDPATVASLEAALAFVVETAQLEPTFRCRLYAEIAVVIVAEAGGRSSTALKQVRVKPPASLPPPGLDQYLVNLNPLAAGVVRAPDDASTCTGGTSLDAGAFPPGRTRICGLPSPLGAPRPAGAFDLYNVCEPDGTVSAATESPDWQWYVTDGDFPDDNGGVGNATGGDLDFDRPQGPFTLWAVIRDGRGGNDWVTFAVSSL